MAEFGCKDQIYTQERNGTRGHEQCGFDLLGLVPQTLLIYLYFSMFLLKLAEVTS